MLHLRSLFRRLGQALKPGRYVHAVPKKIAASNHHVTHVHSDPKLEAAMLWLSGARLCELLLHRHRALDGITALGNSASTLSPAVLAIRPPCSKSAHP